MQGENVRRAWHALEPPSRNMAHFVSIPLLTALCSLSFCFPPLPPAVDMVVLLPAP